MQTQSVRAIISIGDTVFKTPYVKTFNVTRQRGSIWSSATASIELPKGTDVDFTGGSISITVIVDDVAKKLFTGFVDKVDVTPSQSRYSNTMISINAYDVLYKLRNLKVNRRFQLAADKLWCAITGLVRKDVKTEAGLTKEPTHSVIVAVEHTGNYLANLSTTNRPVINKGSIKDLSSTGSNIVGTDGTVIPHTHDSFKQGGPAIGVFGDYKLYTDE
jgi:hypothetical protein